MSFWSLFRRLLGLSEAKANPEPWPEFQFVELSDTDERPKNQWYRLERWRSERLLLMNTTYSKDWKTIVRDQIVVGTRYENRERGLRILAQSEGFRVFLERDPENEHDANAIKVMGEAKGIEARQLGFLPREVASQLESPQELDARPNSVTLPGDGYRVRFTVDVLGRSKAYLKKKKKVT